LSTEYFATIINSMQIHRLHSWQISPAQALDIQRTLSNQVSRNSEAGSPRLVAGVDLSHKRGQTTATAAVVVLEYPAMRLTTVAIAQGEPSFPYIPGLLSFREAPLILAACQKLTIKPDFILVDGQGIAHPRRLGLASHLGLFLDIPTIGCAKSRLCGNYQEPAMEPGHYAEITDNGEIIGAALRTKRNVKPIYVSIGHKFDLETAIYQVMQCCKGYRLPEPTRLAHLAAGGQLHHDQAQTVVK